MNTCLFALRAQPEEKVCDIVTIQMASKKEMLLTFPRITDLNKLKLTGIFIKIGILHWLSRSFHLSISNRYIPQPTPVAALA